MANVDFTTYTEVDPDSKVTVTSSEVSWTGLALDSDTYVYKDYGSAFFDGDFTHEYETEITSTDSGSFVMNWSLANTVDDWKGIADASGSLLSLHWFSTTPAIQMNELDSGTQYPDTSVTLNRNQVYYLTVERDESVGTYGTLYCYIYSDSNRTTLVDTLTLALHTSKKDFRYQYSCQTYNSGGTAGQDVSVANLDLNLPESSSSSSQSAGPVSSSSSSTDSSSSDSSASSDSSITESSASSQSSESSSDSSSTDSSSTPSSSSSSQSDASSLSSSQSSASSMSSSDSSSTESSSTVSSASSMSSSESSSSQSIAVSSSSSSSSEQSAYLAISDEEQMIIDLGQGDFSLQTRSETVNADGSRTPSWTTVKIVAGWRQMVSSDVRERYSRREIMVDSVIYIAEDPETAEGDRIVAPDGQKYYLRGVENQAGLDRLWHLDCERVR